MHKVNVRYVFRKYQGRNDTLQGWGKIYAVIAVDFEETEPFSTHEALKKSDWLGTTKLSRDKELNIRLETLRNNIKTLATMLTMQGETITPTSLKDFFLSALNKARTPRWTLLEACEKYREHKRLEGLVTESTLGTYDRRTEYLRKYLVDSKKLNTTTADFTLDLFTKLNTWGLTRGDGQDFISKVRQFVKTVLEFSRSNEQAVDERIFKERLSWSNEENPKPLTAAQIENLKALNLPPHLTRVRDAFLFARFTCLHFADYFKLSEKHIVEGFIIKPREKTGIEQRVPLSADALAIIRKYGGIDDLPKISATYHNALCLANRYLKDIGALIDEPALTFSQARDTYLDDAYNNRNIRPETENRIAGWSSQRQASRYRRASLETLKKELGLD